MGFELLHVGVFAGRLLGGHQVGLQFREALVLAAKYAEQDLAIGIGAFVFRFGEDCGNVGGQTEIERRAVGYRDAELAERVLAADEVLIDHQLDRAAFHAFERLLQGKTAD